MLSFFLEKIKYLEKRMKKILSLAILLSLITSTLMPVMAIEDTVLQAGAEQQKVQNDSQNNKKKKSEKGCRTFFSL